MLAAGGRRSARLEEDAILLQQIHQLQDFRCDVLRFDGEIAGRHRFYDRSRHPLLEIGQKTASQGESQVLADCRGLLSRASDQEAVAGPVDGTVRPPTAAVENQHRVGVSNRAAAAAALAGLFRSWFDSECGFARGFAPGGVVDALAGGQGKNLQPLGDLIAEVAIGPTFHRIEQGCKYAVQSQLSIDERAVTASRQRLVDQVGDAFLVGFAANAAAQRFEVATETSGKVLELDQLIHFFDAEV